jgi:hypothetical protein
VSYDETEPIPHNVDMDRLSETEERALFIQRVRSARVGRFKTQEPICLLLGVPQDTYKQYETRTPLPYRLIPKFIAACQISYEWLLTGQGEGPMLLPMPTPRKRKIKVPKRRTA